jgi:long-chain alkane monooxygenase
MTRLRFNAFTMNTLSHIHHGLWANPNSNHVGYKDLDTWVDLARLLERGKFDAIFFADVVGIHDSSEDIRNTSIEVGVQFPINDPSLLVSAMAYVTENLGFAFTHSVLQDHPFNFARRMSTLDHLTKGRLAWNIVTSYLPNAARNLGHGALPPHDERYARAQEYVDVTYKLWEGSWEDDAVVLDRENRVYADPSKVHPIDHSGNYYPDIPGPHLSEPSQQRTPVLFQAGSSEQGKEFAARNGEAIFVGTRTPEAARVQVDDIRSRARRHGRDPEDLLFFQGLGFVVGGTEEEVRRKQSEIDEYASDEGYAANLAGSMGIDLGKIDLDAPVSEVRDTNSSNVIRAFIDSAPNKSWTLGDVLRYTADLKIAGTPEQIADELESWADAGIAGINVLYYTTPGSFEDFIDGVTPVLQARGLQQREYRPGTLREKLSDGRLGPRLADDHPAASYRRAGVRA